MTDMETTKDPARQLFDTLDRNKSGFIEEEELDQFLTVIGVVDDNLRQQQIPVILHEMDLDRDGRVSFDEFVTVARKMGLDFESALHAAEHNTEASVNDSMQTNVSVDDSTMHKGGQSDAHAPITPLQAVNLFDELDLDGDGRVEGQDIVRMLSDRCGLVTDYEQDLVLQKKFGIQRDGSLTQDDFEALGREGKLSQAMLRTESPEELKHGAQRMSRRSAVDTETPYTAVTKMLAKDKRDTLWQLFNIADEDRDGTIGLEELSSILQDQSLLGQYDLALGHLDEDLTKRIMDDVDSSGDGVLDFDEFCLAFSGLLDPSARGSSAIITAEAKALLEENKKLRKELQKERESAANYRSTMDRRVNSEKMSLLEAHDSTEAELRQTLERQQSLEKDKRQLEVQLRELRQTLAEYKEHSNAEAAVLFRKGAGESEERIKIEYLEKQLKDLHDNNEVLERALTDTLKEKDEAEAHAEAEMSVLRERVGQLKSEKEHLEVALADSQRVTSHTTSSAATTTTDAGETADLRTVEKELASQKALSFDLTNERDALQKEIQELRAKASADKASAPASASAGPSKQEMEVLNTRLAAAMQEMRDLKEKNNRLQEELDEARAPGATSSEAVQQLQNKVDEYEADRNRLEEERKHVLDMKKEMEALQAMVVAQTAELTMKQQPQHTPSEIEQLRSELELQRRLTGAAEKRAAEAVQDREKAIAAAQNEPLTQASVASTAGGQEEVTAAQATAMKSIQAMATLRKENKTLKHMLKKLHEAYKKRIGGEAGGDVAKLRKDLQSACAEIARLTVELDTARHARGSIPRPATADAGQKDVSRQLAVKERHAKQLEESLHAMEERLQNALETIKGFRDQACVQIEVKKETIHTREKRNGQRVPVDKKAEQKVLTYFTDAKTPGLKSAPWTESEDRILLQAQLQLGGDWVEIAKLLPGRSDEDIAGRWAALSKAITAKADSKPEEQLHMNDNHNDTANMEEALDRVYEMARDHSVRSRKSEGVYEIADVEDQEQPRSKKTTQAFVTRSYEEPSLLATV